MQPAQDWLPISIPHTYLMVAPSEEGADGVILIAHLFCFISASLSISWRHSSASLPLFLQQARNPTNQGERQLMLDRQSSPGGLVFRETAGCCNKPYRPLVPWWTGSRLSREVTVQVSEQATSQNLGSPAAYTSISSRRFIPRRAIPKLLYEPKYSREVIPLFKLVHLSHEGDLLLFREPFSSCGLYCYSDFLFQP